MRTTLTLDDDVAAQLEQLRRKERVKLRDLVNDALRRGLQERRKPPAPVKSWTKPRNLGRCLLPNLDDISEVLAYAEGENHK
jgi:predicted transcriptional regulator